MYVIVNVLPTDYDRCPDRQTVQTIADELNKSAIEEDQSDRWIVVEESFIDGFLTKNIVS
jgi:hypothetical protein